MMDTETKDALLALAREAIHAHGDRQKLEALARKRITRMESGCFVSVFVDGELRGCIGNLDPRDLCESIVHNAVAAAYEDSRFAPLSAKELPRMKVHINILSEPRAFAFSSLQQLLDKMDEKPGVILEKGYHVATFLPSVWEELPDKEEFLGALCRKAGLPQEAWKSAGTKVFVYTSEEFSE